MYKIEENMKFTTYAMILALFFCTHTSQPMAIDYQKLSKQSDELLRQEIFPADYDQQNLDQKIQNVSYYKKSIEDAQAKASFNFLGLQHRGDTQTNYYKSLEYAVQVYPRIVRIYSEELDKLKRRKHTEEMKELIRNLQN